MPLDTGVLTEVDFARGRPSAARSRLTLDPDMNIGEALKAARESLGLTLEQVSEATRIKPRHLEAIEASDPTQLPSRPFVIGYVRAFAKALGLDADAAASRYRAENPGPDDDFRSPVGVVHERRGPSRLVGVVIALTVAAVVTWNVARHAMADAPRKAAAQHTSSATAAHAPATTGPFTAGAPLPAPPEATMPAPYLTPGLEAATAAGGSADAADAAMKASAGAQAKPANPNAAPAAFVAQGAVYGPTSGASGLIIQAKAPLSLEVRGASGAVYFARELAAGEAYRVPNLAGLTAEASNPASAELFEGGVSKGLFPQAKLPLKVGGGAAAAGTGATRAPRPATANAAPASDSPAKAPAVDSAGDAAAASP
jgi:cytoskeletal protein RodZ